MQNFALSGGVLEEQLKSLPQSDTVSWYDVILSEFQRDRERYIKLDEELTELYNSKSVNPQKENIFRAFKECPFETTVAVLCGQDPYPNRSHAVGLSFSIPADFKQPPSLRNILTELENDIGHDIKVRNGDLSSWARQGVLLLNTSLTVEEGSPNSHKDLWDSFAVNILSFLNKYQENPLAFILWGKQAGEIGRLMEREAPDGYPRTFLYSVHPSPLSAYRGFFGSKPFSKVNSFLVENGVAPIVWG